VLKDVHSHSIDNAKEILESEYYGCFSCVEVHTVDEGMKAQAEYSLLHPVTNPSGLIESTVFCPKCMIDSIIGDATGYKITHELMSELEKHWFGEK